MNGICSLLGVSGVARKRGARIASVFIVSAACISGVQSAEYFVSPNGDPSGNGTFESPWDLQTALNHPAGVAPGDLIWLRGGIYRHNEQLTRYSSTLAGAVDQPITVRQYPGERAIIDGNMIQQSGGWVNYWGFEIMNSYPNRVTTESGSFPQAFHLPSGNQTNDWVVSGFDLRAPNVKLINLVVHDSIGGGISMSVSAANSELYGAISYYNGWQGCDRGHGHGLYVQSTSPGVATVVNNAFFSNYALGVQATGNQGVVDNIVLDGNIIFENSSLARRQQGNLLLGAVVGQASNPVLTSNLIFDASGSSSDSNIGYTGGSKDAVVFGNYFQTSVHFSENNSGLDLFDNTFASGTGLLQQSNYPNNRFLTKLPMNNVVVVRTNRYEPGRATVAVYNWGNDESVQVDAGDFLSLGTAFEVRNVQNFRGAPIFNGHFNGGLITLPLTNLPVAKPVGTHAPASTAPAFQTFIIKPLEQSPDPSYSNSAPTILSIPDLVISENSESESVSFSIQDAETPAQYLNISVFSTNPTLVPHSGVRISGTGTNRSVTIMPSKNQTGTTMISLAASDGFLHAAATFNVQIVPQTEPPAQTNEVGGQLTISLTESVADVRVLGAADHDYEIDFSTNLVNWQFLGTVSTDCLGAGRLREQVSQIGSAKYYRLHPHTHH